MEWAVRNQGCGSCWVIFLRFTASSQTQLLAAPERGWARGGGVPSHWRAGLKGPRPRGSRMTGQVLTEASEGRGGRRGPL